MSEEIGYGSNGPGDGGDGNDGLIFGPLNDGAGSDGSMTYGAGNDGGLNSSVADYGAWNPGVDNGALNNPNLNAGAGNDGGFSFGALNDGAMNPEAGVLRAGLQHYGVRYLASQERRDIGVVVNDTLARGSHVESRFQLGQYNPDAWNAPHIRYVNNCYAYAWNIRADNANPEPGYGYFGRGPTNNSELYDAVWRDGLVKLINDSWPESQVTGFNDAPAWLVAMGSFTSPDTNTFGYHFYRKVWSGEFGPSPEYYGPCGEGGVNCFFAHKYLDESVTNMIQSGPRRGQLIHDPRWDMEARGIEFLGMFLARPYRAIYSPIY